MKFHIFGVWEKIAKPVICCFLILLTIGLLCSFFALYCAESAILEIFIFIAPVVYALLLFLANILLEKVKHLTDEKLYEREGYFLSILKLREITNATINVIDRSNISDIESKILMFQIMTGRDESTIQELIQNGKSSHYFLKENGFIYLSKMKKLESEALACIKGNGEPTEVFNSKPLNSLLRFYKRKNKKLENIYHKLKKIYGGNLQHLVGYDDFVSDFYLKMDDIKSRIDDVLSEIEELHQTNKSIEENNESMNEAINSLGQQISERLDDIEFLIASEEMDNNPKQKNN